MKREDYINWDAYFMGIALLSAERSKDPNTRVGACIVSEDNKILSVGYNGMPMGCSDDEFPWSREGNDMKGAKIYITLFPCNECAKALIQKGIKEIIYMSDKYAETDIVIASKRMLDAAGVNYRQYNSINKEIILSL
jgi:dCMP deaminase